MREIKFRGWVKENQKMVRITGFDFDDKYGEWEYEDGENYCISQEHIELMQYTGLKDKNGKEIYEGDIIKFKTIENRIIIGVVQLYNCCWIVPGDYGTPLNILKARCKSVIGNIHKNPELLKEKK